MDKQVLLIFVVMLAGAVQPAAAEVNEPFDSGTADFYTQPNTSLSNPDGYLRATCSVGAFPYVGPPRPPLPAVLL